MSTSDSDNSDTVNSNSCTIVKQRKSLIFKYTFEGLLSAA